MKALPRRQETSDMTPQLIEEYILETAERGQARVYHTRYRRKGLSYLQDVGGTKRCILVLGVAYLRGVWHH